MPWMRKSVPQRTAKATTIARIRRLIFILGRVLRISLRRCKYTPDCQAGAKILKLAARWIDIFLSSQHFAFLPQSCGLAFLCVRGHFSRAVSVLLRSDLGSFFKQHSCTSADMRSGDVR